MSDQPRERRDRKRDRTTAPLRRVQVEAQSAPLFRNPWAHERFIRIIIGAGIISEYVPVVGAFFGINIDCVALPHFRLRLLRTSFWLLGRNHISLLRLSVMGETTAVSEGATTGLLKGVARKFGFATLALVGLVCPSLVLVVLLGADRPGEGT